jgi:hypothetical protein
VSQVRWNHPRPDCAMELTLTFAQGVIPIVIALAASARVHSRAPHCPEVSKCPNSTLTSANARTLRLSQTVRQLSSRRSGHLGDTSKEGNGPREGAGQQCASGYLGSPGGLAPSVHSSAMLGDWGGDERGREASRTRSATGHLGCHAVPRHPHHNALSRAILCICGRDAARTSWGGPA